MKPAALAFAVYGLATFNQARQQESIWSTIADYPVLKQKAAETGNTELQALLQGFSPIALKGPTGSASDEVYVPGDIDSTFDWKAQTDQKVRLRNGHHVVVTSEQLQELANRKQKLLANRVLEAPQPTQEQIDADVRAEAAYWDNLKASPPPGTSENPQTQAPPPHPVEVTPSNSPANPEPRSIVAIAPDTNFLTTIETIALGVAALVLLAFNPRTSVVGLAFVVLGAPVWWWMSQSISGNLNEFSDPSSIGSAVLHSARSYIRPFSVFWVLFFVISFIRHVYRSKPARTSGSGAHIQAEGGVPHCRLVLNNGHDHGQGFKVDLFNSNGTDLGKMVLVLLGITLAIWYFVSGVTPTFMLVLVLGSALAYFVARRPHTQIEVNPSSVIIDGSPLERAEFRSFYLWSPRLLGCEYGLQRFHFGGDWNPEKATEIAAALNLHLVRTPITGPPIPKTPARPAVPTSPEDSTPRRKQKY
jgi:hypothetical protein